ncbi:hypothetical protein OESDEN_16208 [Oesophagostomum dentatum]|uniref:Hexosyltransferase n=1 Tax=Oesophagostomum dentatum TaxID=61180 RepID=A0A0B1SKQ7_OESDE|nr:hypothetical protein OESDEN_16208 [Oesophagostomum dentatum]
MFFPRRYKNLLLRPHTLLLLVAVVFLWFIGVFDHLLEESFDEFRWPPYDFDVAAETFRADAGKPFRLAVINDLREFRRLAEPECHDENEKLKLLVIVKSAVPNEKQRNAIRKTWGLHRGSVRVVFIVGVKSDAAAVISHTLPEEIRVNKDILHVDVLDTYRNNTLKFFHSISYAFKPNKGCPVPDFVLLVDDDYMVSVNGLLQHTDGKNISEHVS